jgi:hypothetical protein
MSEKFPMKLVIDEVTTPFLYARLCAAGSPRERAALLRSIAESGLRGAANGESSPPARGSAGVHFASERQPESHPDPVGERQLTTEAPPFKLVSNDDLGQGHDTYLLTDEFASFF